FPTLALQCMGKVSLETGSIKFNAEKIPFLISPVYPVPPIKAIFLVKSKMAKLCCLVPSSCGFALNPGAFITVHSGVKCFNSSSVGRKNILYANWLLQGYSVITRIFV